MRIRNWIYPEIVGRHNCGNRYRGHVVRTKYGIDICQICGQEWKNFRSKRKI